jgi:hypothetical protein
MSNTKSYERVLGAFVAQARVGRIGRVVTGGRGDASLGKSLGARAWINGNEVGGPNPRFAHLGRSLD